MPSTSSIIQALSLATLVGDIFIVFALMAVTARHLLRKPCLLTAFIRRHGLLLLFIVALLASAGSLYFSEIAKFTPCKECWFQRIFMYTQVPLLAVALYRKDRAVAPYILTLCLIGMIFSIKQYVGQVQSILLPALQDTCGDPAANCASTQIFKFGYITIPFMALTAFVMNALMSLVVMRKQA